MWAINIFPCPIIGLTRPNHIRCHMSRAQFHRRQAVKARTDQ